MAKPRLAAYYDDDITAASRSALAEVMITLGAYRDALVLIGGWAPYLILERFGEPGGFQGDTFQVDASQAGPVHVGSIDIDLVVDPDVVDAEHYATIVERLLERGWARALESRFQFQKETLSPRSGRPHLRSGSTSSPRSRCLGRAASVGTGRCSATSKRAPWRGPRSPWATGSGTRSRRHSLMGQWPGLQ